MKPTCISANKWGETKKAIRDLSIPVIVQPAGIWRPIYADGEE